MRRFRPNPGAMYGYPSFPMIYFVGGAAVFAAAIYYYRQTNPDTKLGVFKKHHPLGVGYSSINQQMDKLREITKKFSPSIDEHYYHYSRQKPIALK